MSQKESGTRRPRDESQQQQQQGSSNSNSLANSTLAAWAAAVPVPSHHNKNKNDSNSTGPSAAPAVHNASSDNNNNMVINNLATLSGTFDDAFNDAAPAVEANLVGSLVPANPDEALQELFNQHKILLPRIEFRANDGETKEFVLGRGVELRVPYRIDFGRLSSNHCKFNVIPKPSMHITVTDTSTNGVWVNAERIKKGEPRILKSRDVVTLLKPSPDAVHFPFVFECQAERDKFKDEITCSICLGTYVTPTCVLPCLHTFCGPCVRKFVSEARRNGASAGAVTCPECRSTLTTTSVNHKVQALINEVTRTNPACERPAIEAKQLEEEALDAERKAIKAGVLQPMELSDDGARRARKKKRHDDFLDGEYSGDDEEEDDYSDDSDDDGGNNNGGGGGGWGAGVGAMVGAVGGAVARGFGFGGGGAAAGWNHLGQQHQPMHFAFQQNPQACEYCRNPDPRDNFQCPPGGPHIVCKYCRKVFPDRPACNLPQRCKFCATPFCDVYCGPCKNPAGVGVLREVKDTFFDQIPIANLFKGNSIEQQHFMNYMRDNQLTVKDVWTECLDKWKSKEWTLDLTPGMATTIEPNTPLCKPCAQRVFQTLIVRYRVAIPRDKWPPAVGARPDCWYGLECNTQHKNPMHAQKYNHVCLPRKGKE